ncbi:MAG TPA: PH domain-containing protein [Gemmataceae bacterium]|nr:PH domain-containing protein [Gemmataceae bacterium]
MTYQSEKGLWAKLLPLLGGILIVVGIGVSWITGNLGAPYQIQIAVLLTLIPGVLFLWIPFSTYYEVTDAAVIAHSGPFWRKIPRDAIIEIKPRLGVWYPSWGFALSLDVLLIHYRKKNGKPARLPIAVSPADKDGFLQELRNLAAVPIA